MNEQELLRRIVVDQGGMVGKPVIRGTRLTVEHVLNLLAHDVSRDEILGEYDGLTKDDIRACILFATKSLEDTIYMPLSADTV